ncbi:uncharacterized protein EV420DRAFT_15384 [Desarmillaria tabescens]|uniref:Zn(2)-C6 fungal-type domain-containing protein n=1 Tax=Armillaria tabescens TaxID=1929756 RepID=A0AA39NP62_ARMTA|nr:uncharacterized protein EV420DRAFT_15384 [Desarmillaria tabescens]KAK0469221.1 hypothetical protein EV420DRAFT_15384 [Desarmillaria tabescens]
MTRASSSKRSSGTGTSRGRGTYASHACNVCRAKRVKCDEVKPVCGFCQASGRNDECSWTGESARRPRTEAHYEALRKRADALKAYADLLESLLEKCRREHGGVSEESMSYLQFRPPDAGSAILDNEVPPPHDDGADANQVDGEDITREICVPTRNLKLEDSQLVFYGIAAPFRLDQTPAKSRVTSRLPDVDDPKKSHVLQISDGDGNYYDPDFDWSRHLPSVVPLDRKEHDRVLDLLFKFFTPWCCRVVPELFFRDMRRAISVPAHQTPPRTAHYSPMLHNALVALATAFSDDPQIRDFKSRNYFADEAKRRWEDECRKPTISVAQALSILSSFHTTNGDHTIGYMYFGLSTRVGQALGLSFDSSPWVRAGLISRDDTMDRNQAYWTTFSEDACSSVYGVGRDFTVPQPVERRVSVSFVDSEFDKIPWHYPPANIPPQPNFLLRTLAATSELMMILRQVMDVINGLNLVGTRQEISDEIISKIDLQLHEWKSRLSPEVDITISNKLIATPHRLMLHLSFWWVFILLHRPFFHRRKRESDGDIDHVKMCKRASENIMELLLVWRPLYTLRYVPMTLVQVLFSAGTIYLLLAGKASSGLRVAKKDLERFISQANLCVDYLNEIGKSWNFAMRISGILSNLLHRQLDPLLEKRSAKQARQEETEIAIEADNGTTQCEAGSFGSGFYQNAASSMPTEASHPQSQWFPTQQHYHLSGSHDSNSYGSLAVLGMLNGDSELFGIQPFIPDYNMGSESYDGYGNVPNDNNNFFGPQDFVVGSPEFFGTYDAGT